MSAVAKCTMGVGCDEAGVCYAAAHGQPERCPLSAKSCPTMACKRHGVCMFIPCRMEAKKDMAVLDWCAETILNIEARRNDDGSYGVAA
jgi:hypothetical protein